ncbi:MAG TPA: class III extradiol ring-cleavage dioxygenase [Polyangiaceae bacterium]|jgi:aromatic ring-opening dioxygenase catalytic subunit (LigB family)
MAQQEDALTRRKAIAVGIAGAAAVASVAAASGHGAPATEAESSGRAGKASHRMPVVFLPHGGGPWPFVDTGIGDKTELDELAAYLKSVSALPSTPPKAVLVISAHWEEPVPTVMSGAHPPMLYDYYGFPPESYRISWPAPGSAELAARVQRSLESAGVHSAQNAERGFDHGAFVPLKLMYPNAEVPTVQLSLKRGLDPSEHLAIGRALAPLRDEGVFIVGSGMTYHNLRAFNASSRAVSETFDAWLRETASAEPAERDRRLTNWQQAPEARRVHPREEHLLPLMVAAGAAGADRGRVAYNGTILSLRISAYHFG